MAIEAEMDSAKFKNLSIDLRVFENKVQRRIFGSKKDGLTGEWRKLRNEEIHDLYSLPSIIRIINSRRMRWAEHVARMGEKRKVSFKVNDLGGIESFVTKRRLVNIQLQCFRGSSNFRYYDAHSINATGPVCVAR
jgi:hypothetical protein